MPMLDCLCMYMYVISVAVNDEYRASAQGSEVRAV